MQVSSRSIQQKNYRRPGCLHVLFLYLGGMLAGFGAIALLIGILSWAFPIQNTNILILGLDRRPGESTIARTDTMIIMHLDHEKDAPQLVSIPRDLWVTIPGVGENRINTAHFFAENNAIGSGPTAAMNTVSQNFGVPVDHYVRIDFEAFTALIDAVGGVEITVDSVIIDYAYPTDNYQTEVVQFDPGTYVVDGDRALKYARIRHGSSDFVRAARQQQILDALFSKLASPLIVFRLPSIMAVLQTNIEHDVSPLLAARSIPFIYSASRNGLNRHVIEGDMVQPYRTSGGASVLLPRWDAIEPFLQTHLSK